jgi:hypothetical protein
MFCLLFPTLGTKNVAKSMIKVAVGSMKNAGKTWFPELSDKSMFHFHNLYLHYMHCCREEYKSPPVLLHEKL